MRTLVAIAAVLLLSACAPSAPGGYPPGAELGFKTSCESAARRSAGASVEQSLLVGYCDCVWQRIKTEVAYSEFQAFERMSPAERSASQTQQKFTTYALACAGTLQSGAGGTAGTTTP